MECVAESEHVGIHASTAAAATARPAATMPTLADAALLSALDGTYGTIVPSCNFNEYTPPKSDRSMQVSTGPPEYEVIADAAHVDDVR